MAVNGNTYAAHKFGDEDIIEKTIGTFLDVIDPHIFRVPKKWYRLSDFKEYSLLTPTDEHRIQPADMVEIPSSHTPKNRLCGFLRSVGYKTVLISMANPGNDSMSPYNISP